MDRVPADDLARLKSQPIADLVARRVKLTPCGADLVGLCCFHDDKSPSLKVTPAKNLWHCFGCGKGGDVVAWVMETEGVSFRHAVEMLKAGAVDSGQPKTAPKLASPLVHDVDDARLLGQVCDYYRRCLLEEPDALAYVIEKRGLSRAVVDRFRLGFCNRTLGLRLPEKNRAAGTEIRTRLEKLGVLRSTGHEHFRGCVTIPIIEHDVVRGLYGRKIDERSKPHHLYLPGPHRGVFNVDGFEGAREIILCESLIDALTFASAGLLNVTTSFGVEGFTAELFAALKTHKIERVVVAYDADDAGNGAAIKLIEQLKGDGLDAVRAVFPRGMDANEYARKVKPSEKALRLVLEQARSSSSTSSPVAAKTAAKEEEQSSPLAAEPPAATTPAPPIPPSTATTMTTTTAKPAAPDLNSDELSIAFGDRRYRVRGVLKNVALDVLRINLLVARGEAFHVDTLDLYAAKLRAGFVAAAAHELRVDVDVIKADVGRILRQLEEHQTARIKALLDPQPVVVEMSAQEREAALSLLRDPALLDRIVADFERCGVVGEKTNKLMGYLAAVSRKLEDPLAIIIQSSSAAGKSSLMEAVLAFVPDEEKVKFSAMTGQSLFYMSGRDLKHKVLAIVEEEGAEKASYSLKLLQSEKELSIAATGKDPTTGRQVTHEYRVEGPVMIFLTTTAIEIDEELLNRCVVLTVDEDRAQTRAIHQIQRQRQTIEGLLARQDASRVLDLHKNAQRLLSPLLVANPFAERLTFLDDKTRTRRDHMKYLTLIRSIALLHQHQRKKLTATRDGQVLEYIEATVDDVAVANALCHEVLGRSLDELPPQTRRLLFLLDDLVKAMGKEQGLERHDLRFTRRQVREVLGWSDTQLKVHLGRLVELELVAVHREHHEQRHLYELRFDGQGKDGTPFLPGLLDVEKLRGRTYEANRSAPDGNRSEPGRAVVGGWPGGGRPPVVDDKLQKRAENAHPPSKNPAAVDSHINGAGE